MTLLSSCARTGARRVRRDHSVALILFMLMVLVFAPVVGLHIVLTTFGSAVVDDLGPPDGLAAAPVASKRLRG